MTKINKGILFAFLTSVISGIAIFFSKISVSKIDPLVLTTSRNLFVGVILLLFFLIKGRWSEIKKINRMQMLNLILIGLIGGFAPFYLFFTGLTLTQAVSANLIHKTLFIWVTVLALIFLREKLNLSYVISFLLIILANFYFADFKFVIGKGEVMVLAATILWSIENILAKKVLKSVSSELVGLFRMGVGGSLLFITTIFTQKTEFFLTMKQWSNVSIIIVGGTILFFYVFTWYKALKYAPAGLVTLILTFSIVVGNILNGVFAEVKILPKDINTSVLISSGLFIIFVSHIFEKLSFLHKK